MTSRSQTRYVLYQRERHPKVNIKVKNNFFISVSIYGLRMLITNQTGVQFYLMYF